jgi:hypothetical protein
VFVERVGSPLFYFSGASATSNQTKCFISFSFIFLYSGCLRVIHIDVVYYALSPEAPHNGKTLD